MTRFRVWEPWDPVTIVSAPLGRLISNELDLDRIAADVAGDKAEQGAQLARAAGFDATARVVGGKVWQAICEVADELDAEPIVIGSRGLGRAGSALLGSVSAAVIAHAKRAVLVGPANSTSGAGPGPASRPAANHDEESQRQDESGDDERPDTVPG